MSYPMSTMKQRSVAPRPDSDTYSLASTVNPPPAYTDKAPLLSTHEAAHPSGSASAAQSMTTYNMYYTTSYTNLRLHLGDSSSPVVYYAQSKNTWSAPLVLLRRGNSKKAPCTAWMRFHYASRDMQIGLGDIQDQAEVAAGNVTNEQLVREKHLARCSDYRLAVADPSTGERMTLAWRRDKARPLASVYDCVDGDGNVLGRMLSGGALNLKKGGELLVADRLSVEVRELIMVSAVGVWAVEGLNYHSLTQGFESGKKKSKEEKKRQAEEAAQAAEAADASVQIATALSNVGSSAVAC